MTITPLIQGATLSLFSAGLGYWAGFLKQHREDTRKRKAIASALLTELRWLERMLRKLARHTEAASSTVRIVPTIYDRFEPDLILFDSDVTASLLNFRGFIHDLDLSRENIVSGRATPTPEAHEYFRAKAAGAANLIPRIKSALEKAGGKAPLDETMVFNKRGEMPELRAPAFPEAVRDLPK